MTDDLSPKEITDYFRSNIFESISAYSAWKMLYFSKSKGMINENLVDRYVKIQNFHSNFFATAENAFLTNFVIKILHSFDKRNDSLSLFKVDKEKTEKFVEDNKTVLDNLKKVRHKLLAHRDKSASSDTFGLPSIIEMDSFINNLVGFYNVITSKTDNSATVFSNAEEVMRDIELLFMNLERGEATRKLEIDIDYMWDKDDKKASKLLLNKEKI